MFLCERRGGGYISWLFFSEISSDVFRINVSFKHTGRSADDYTLPAKKHWFITKKLHQNSPIAETETYGHNSTESEGVQATFFNKMRILPEVKRREWINEDLERAWFMFRGLLQKSRRKKSEKFSNNIFFFFFHFWRFSGLFFFLLIPIFVWDFSTFVPMLFERRQWFESYSIKTWMETQKSYV